jgi:hypothetical protein
LTGGNAVYTDADGGFPGGGCGGGGGFNAGVGGGGGGFYGGGGGGMSGGSGGGGSGWVSDAGSDASLLPAQGSQPPRRDDIDYDKLAGQGGARGLVVIRLVKPY